MTRIQLSIVVALAAVALATIACGQPLTTAEQTQTAQAVISPVATTTVTLDATAAASTTVAAAATTTVDATAAAQPTPPSPPQLFAEATPVDLTPITAGAAARTNCPAGFATFRDVTTSLSVCGLDWLHASSDVNNVGAPGMSLSTPDDAPSSLPRVSLAARVTPRRKFGPSVTPSTLCNYDAVAAQVSIEEVHLTIAGLSGLGCHAVGEAQSPDGPLELVEFSAALPVLGDGEQRYLNFDLTWRTDSPGARELAYQMIQSIALP